MPARAERVLPHSDEAEISVLGAMLVEESAADRALEMLVGEDFYHAAHRHIFRAISGLCDEGHVPDAMSVRGELCRLNVVEGAGGDAYLARIVDIVPTAANLPYHAKIVLDLSAKRRLIEAGTEIVNSAYENSKPSADLHAQAIERLEKAAPRANGRDERRRIRILAEEDLYAQPRPKWIVDEVLVSEGTTEIFGAAKSGKTFVALDLALCIQTGMPYYGHGVQKGQVLYIIGEGQSALPDRIDAWKVANRWQGATGIWTITTRLSLLRDEDFQELRAEIRDFRARKGRSDDPILLTVLDTLNRTFGGGDENKTADMTVYTERMDLLHEDTGGNVAAVHHTGHENTGRGRGSSVLIGAVDTSIQVEKSGGGPWYNVEVSCNEQRNAEPFESLRFKMEPHLGSVTLRHVSAVQRGDGDRAAELAENERKIMATVQLPVFDDGASAAQIMETTGMAKSSFYNAANSLLDKRLLGRTGQGRAKRFIPTELGRKAESPKVQCSPVQSNETARSESSPVQGPRGPGLLDTGLDTGGVGAPEVTPSHTTTTLDEPSVEDLIPVVADAVERFPASSRKALGAHVKEARPRARPAIRNAAINAAEADGWIKDRGENGSHAYHRTEKPIEKEARDL